jgi:type IV pilus assembly protein PilC
VKRVDGTMADGREPLRGRRELGLQGEKAMRYRYSAYSEDKRIVRGLIESASSESAEAVLYKAGFRRVLTLQPTGSALDLNKIFSSAPRINAETLLDFTTELAVLIESGLTLMTALKQLERQISNASLKTVVGKLASNLKGGMPFHQALGLHPQVFNETYCAIVEANEKAGKLDSGFKQITRQLKQQINTRSQIRSAVIQPAIIIGLAIVVLIILTVVVLPPLADIFREFGEQLPAGTRFLIGLADFLNQFKFIILLAVVALVAVVLVFLKRPDSKPLIDRLLLRLPLIGPVVIMNNTAQISRTLSNLLAAGILLPDALQVMQRGVPNSTFREALASSRKKLLQGESFSSSIAQNKLFPSLLVEMIGIGEVSGNLENSLSSVADYFEAKVEKRIIRLTSLIEPILIMSVGLLVGLIAVTMISSIYGMMGNF